MLGAGPCLLVSFVSFVPSVSFVSVTIEPLTSADQIADVLAIEEASFTS